MQKTYTPNFFHQCIQHFFLHIKQMIINFTKQ
jgi:hypothetical protein